MKRIVIKNSRLKWLFGGFGFHNSEATMTPLMSKKLKNERILKTFREISPTYARVFAGYADWTKEAMDAFADYYDATFRRAGTLLYLVPGRMPYITDDFDMEEYCERVAKNLEYLIKVRQCTKIRYYCVTNELSVGNTYAYLSGHLDLLKKLHECLYKAFRRHYLDIGLLATDCSGTENFHQITWAKNNMDEVTECYCAHLYSEAYAPGDLRAYSYYYDAFAPMVMEAHSKEKRFVLGEFGINAPGKFKKYPMRNDVSYCVDVPEKEAMYAIALCEMAMAAINCGCMATVLWTMFDYPDPFIRENGDTAEEKAKYDVSRFSGHGLDIRYNKNGLVRWCDDENDHSARAALYTVGYMAKLFKKGSRVLDCEWNDDEVRACAVVYEGDTVSVCIINWGNEKTLELELDIKPNKPMRRYGFAKDDVPYNSFNDLQGYSELVNVDILSPVKLSLAPYSVTFLTSDYMDRTPGTIRGIRAKGSLLKWKECKEPEHCYYRVYKDGKQIASTVATSIEIAPDKGASWLVTSVDKYGNEGKCR